jgi:heme/copper-type cytochrome/quinol oxidase subunit 2
VTFISDSAPEWVSKLYEIIQDKGEEKQEVLIGVDVILIAVPIFLIAFFLLGLFITSYGNKEAIKMKNDIKANESENANWDKMFSDDTHKPDKKTDV